MTRISKCDVCGKEIKTGDDHTFITVSFSAAVIGNGGKIIEDEELGTIEDEIEEYVSMTTCKACNVAARNLLTKKKVLRILSSEKKVKKK